MEILGYLAIALGFLIILGLPILYVLNVWEISDAFESDASKENIDEKESETSDGKKQERSLVRGLAGVGLAMVVVAVLGGVVALVFLLLKNDAVYWAFIPILFLILLAFLAGKR